MVGREEKRGWWVEGGAHNNAVLLQPSQQVRNTCDSSSLIIHREKMAGWLLAASSSGSDDCWGLLFTCMRKTSAPEYLASEVRSSRDVESEANQQQREKTIIRRRRCIIAERRGEGSRTRGRRYLCPPDSMPRRWLSRRRPLHRPPFSSSFFYRTATCCTGRYQIGL